MKDLYRRRFRITALENSRKSLGNIPFWFDLSLQKHSITDVYFWDYLDKPSWWFSVLWIQLLVNCNSQLLKRVLWRIWENSQENVRRNIWSTSKRPLFKILPFLNKSEGCSSNSLLGRDSANEVFRKMLQKNVNRTFSENNSWKYLIC